MAKKNSDIIGQVDRLASNVRKGRTSYYDAPSPPSRSRLDDAQPAVRAWKWNPAYKHFVFVPADADEEAFVDSGWEFKSDAEDRAKEMREDGSRAKVISRSTLRLMGGVND